MQFCCINCKQVLTKKQTLYTNCINDVTSLVFVVLGFVDWEYGSLQKSVRSGYVVGELTITNNLTLFDLLAVRPFVRPPCTMVGRPTVGPLQASFSSKESAYDDKHNQDCSGAASPAILFLPPRGLPAEGLLMRH